MARISKQQFRNQSGGWIGVVVIGPKGDEKGIPVENDHTVWLSEEEQILTANAPRYAEDNPFVPWKRRVLNDETGQFEEREITPLVAINEARPVPANYRPIPSDISDAAATREAMAGATGDEPIVPTTAELGAATRHAEVAAMGEDTQPHQAPRVPRRAAMAAAAKADLPMTDALAETQHDEDLARESAQTPPHTPPDAPTPPGAAASEPEASEQADEEAEDEEHAAAVDPEVGEETGAAVPPTADAPQGEYAAHEEVGTPDAPSQQAKPWTPGEAG